MATEESIKKEVLDLYVEYANSIGRDTSHITADTKLAFPAGLKFSDVQRKSFKPSLNNILSREGKALLVNSDVLGFSNIKDAQDKVWGRVKPEA